MPDQGFANRVGAFVWRPGREFEMLPGLHGWPYATALASSSDGTVVGLAMRGATGHRAVIWQSGIPAPLTGLDSYTDSEACAVNRSRQVAGVLGPYAGQAFLWSAGTGMAVLAKPPGFRYSSASAIDDAGDIAGYCWGAPGTAGSACLWNRSGCHLLGPAPAPFYRPGRRG